MRSYSLPSKRSLSTAIVWLFVAAFLLGIFLAICPIKFISRGDDARIAAAKAEIQNLGDALENFRADVGRYPTTGEGLQALWSGQSIANWRGPYMGKAVTRDPWGRPYIYRCPGKHNPSGFDLLSFGRDGREGSADDIDN